MTATVGTYTATIYVGLMYTPIDAPKELHSLAEAREVCQAFVDKRMPHPELPGGCVTVTPTEFVYGNGGEPGVIVGLINYPRFPTTKELLRETALDLARRLQRALRQKRVTVVFPDETVMLEQFAP